MWCGVYFRRRDPDEVPLDDAAPSGPPPDDGTARAMHRDTNLGDTTPRSKDTMYRRHLVQMPCAR